MDSALPGDNKPGGIEGVGDAVDEVARVLAHGDFKHGVRDWAKNPLQWSTHLKAVTRHINRWLHGLEFDESGESALAHAIGRLLILRQMQIERRGKDDRFLIFPFGPEDM